jgi:hypothetical protein
MDCHHLRFAVEYDEAHMACMTMRHLGIALDLPFPASIPDPREGGET